MGNSRQSWTRRGFLRAAAGAVGAGYVARPASGVDLADADELVLQPDTPRAEVVVAESRFVSNGPKVHEGMLRELLDTTLMLLTGGADIVDAWSRLVKPDDVIGIKFNRSARVELGTTPSFASVLVASLKSTGVPLNRIVCIEGPPLVGELAGTRPALVGYERESVDFGSGSDELSRALGQVTALINVPFLKTHNLCGMTCALKNLSHGLVKHPARYHADGCAPFIADINLLKEIRGKLRLNVVDALRVVYDGGPDARSGRISDAGLVIASRDPVAVDAVGLSILNDIRAGEGMDEVARTASQLPYLADAHRKGLGVAVPHGIEVYRERLS